MIPIFYFYVFASSTYLIIGIVCFCLVCTTCMRLSRFTHPAMYVRISFVKLRNTPLHIYTTFWFCLHLECFQLLATVSNAAMSLNTQIMFWSLCFSSLVRSSYFYLEAVLCLNFRGTTKLFFTAVIAFSILNSNRRTSTFSTSSHLLWCRVLLEGIWVAWHGIGILLFPQLLSSSSVYLTPLLV